MKPMYLLRLALALLLLCGAQTAVQAQYWQWAKRAGGPSEEQGRSIALDAAGNTYVAGFFADETNFGTGQINAHGGAGADLYLAKYNTSGNLVWVQTAGGNQDDVANALVTDAAGNVYLTGHFQDTAYFGNFSLVSAGSYDAYVAKYSPAGGVQWVQQYGGPSAEIGYSLALDQSGNILLSGMFQNTGAIGPFTLVSAGAADGFVAKLNSTGTVLWAQQLGGAASHDVAYRISTDGSGNSFVAGTFWGTAAFGAQTLTSAGNADIFLAKYNPSGTLVWVKRAGGIQEDNVFGLTTDNAGNALLTGFFRHTANFGGTNLTTTGVNEIYLARYTTDGDLDWVRQAGGTGFDAGWAVATDAAGNSYVSGNFQGTATFGSLSVTSIADRDIFVAKYNPAGAVQWVQSAGGALFQNAQAIASDASGNSFLTGFIESATTFGSHTLGNAGSFDVFVARVSDCGGVLANAGPDQVTCSGNTINLGSAPQAGVTYTWSVTPAIMGFAASQSQMQVAMPSATVATTYTFTVTATGTLPCPVTDQVLVTVNPVPEVAVTSPDFTICSGGSTMLTATGATSFSWHPSPSLDSVSVVSVLAHPVSSSVYTVSGSNPGCSPVTQTITVSVINPPAASAILAGPACMGQNLDLTATGSAANTYSWTGPGNFSSSGQTVVVNNLTSANAGTYSVIATGPNPGCISEPGSQAVAVYPIPDPTSAFNGGAVCAGQPLYLSAAPVSGALYTWSGPAGFFSTGQTTQVPNTTQAMSGDFGVTVTVNGCQSAAAYTSATILYTPTVTSVIANTPVCIGSDIELSAEAGLGATYSWVGPGGFGSANQNPVRANADTDMTGTYTVFAESGGCVSAAGTVYVAVVTEPSMPVPFVNSPVCEGQPAQFGVAFVPGAAYSWVGPGGFASLLPNPVIAQPVLADAGQYTVFSIGAGCIPKSDVINLQVKATPPMPAASNSGPVCEGGANVVLTANSSFPGVTYAWSGPAGFTAATQTTAVPAAAAQFAGLYSVTATFSGCTSLPGTTFVQINLLPAVTVTASADTVGPGGSLQLLAAAPGNGPYSYSWFPATGLSNAGIANPTATISSTTTYSVLVTDESTGCASTGEITIVVASDDGLLSDRREFINLWPNPFRDDLTVQFMSLTDQEIMLLLLDITGKAIIRTTVKVSEGLNYLPVTVGKTCGAGMYLLLVQTSGQQFVQRVIKTK